MLDQPKPRQRMGARLALLLALATCLASLAPAGPVAAAEQHPTVRFDYSFVPFDRSCSQRTGYEIPEAQIEELTRRLPSFQEHWDAAGPRLLAATTAATGQPFHQRELIAVMTLCDFPSMSHPLLLNMRRFLESSEDQSPQFLFTALVYHELLHIYVTDVLETSALREKYKDEPFSVLSHLHLMALMKKTYLEVGRKDELDHIIRRYKEAKREVYIRAWEIVHEIEGHQPFIDELKASSAPERAK